MFTALPVVPTPAQAQTDVPLDWPLKPSGLGRGDTFRLMFITSGTVPGVSDEITFYDDHVKGAADNGHTDIQEHQHLFRVLGSTSDVDARDHTNTNRRTDGAGEPIYWLGGGKIADNYADFYDGLWASREPRNELGEEYNPDLVFTGSFNSGAKHDHPLGSATPRAGDPDESSPVNRRVLSKENVAQSTRLPFYGMSPVFRVQAVVPDPPGNVGAVRNSERLVTITWSAPYDGGAALTEYTVSFVAGVLPARIIGRAKPGFPRYTHLRKNVPLDVEVFVEVRARNRVGRSQPAGVRIPAGVVTASISGGDLTWTLAGQTEVVQGDEYTYMLTRTPGNLPKRERFGFHSDTLGINRFSGLANCEGSAYFCISVDSAYDYVEMTVRSINLGYVLLRDSDTFVDTRSYPVTVRVADNAPVGTTINMGLIDDNTPRTPSLTLTVLKRPDNKPAAGRPVITGTAVVGQTLTADISAITDRDGLPGKDDFSYQWIVNDGDSEVSGATDATYMLSGDDIGKTVKVRVSFTDDRDNQEVVTSEATDPVDGAIVSISEPEGQFEEGHSGSNNRLVFTLTRTHRMASFTTVNVEVVWDPPSGVMFFDGMSPEERTATFAAGSDKTELMVPIHGDEVWDPHTSVTASVESGYGYLPSESDNSAVKTVNDDDLPAMEVELVLSSMAVEEDIGSFTVRVVARTDRDEEPHRDLPLSLVTEAGTAESPSDYEAVDRMITLSGFMRGQDNVYTAEAEVRVTIHDDTDDERGRDEEFSLLVRRGGDVNADAVRLSNGGRYRVSILDLNEEPEITGASSFIVKENSTAVFATLTATDPEGAELTWSIVGGADTLAFDLTEDGRLSFKSAKDFERPDDVGEDRTYELDVEVGDGTNSVPQTITVVLKDVNESPETDRVLSFDVEENSTAVFTTLTATDPEDDPLTWSIAGGEDGGAFTLTGDGRLSFTSAKDFEGPDDVGKDGTYHLTVRVSDGANSRTAEITVTLSDDGSREFSLGFSSLPFLPPGSSATVTLTLVNATSLEASEQVVVKLEFMPPDGVSAALVPAPEMPISELTFSRDVPSHDLILTVAGDAQTPVVTLRAEVPSHNLDMTIITPAELTIYLYDSIRMRIKVFLEGALN